jgi:hypothetical protein
VRIPASSKSIIPKIPSFALILAAALCLSCGKKEQPAPQKQPPSYDLTGEWRSEIESGERIIAASVYRITQKRDSVALELVSTKSPSGEELVPDGMWLKARGAWQKNALRLEALSWINGRDTCMFHVRGDMDTEGRLLLHFPADICGEKSLPYTRKLCRPSSEGE